MQRVFGIILSDIYIIWPLDSKNSLSLKMIYFYKFNIIPIPFGI